ncbi:hypothetical protein DQP56_17120 [Mycolicibacter senuensis]|nr:hypothetical protein DQP56_17120 [Mycolicibacter senuensis]
MWRRGIFSELVVHQLHPAVALVGSLRGFVESQVAEIGGGRFESGGECGVLGDEVGDSVADEAGVCLCLALAFGELFFGINRPGVDDLIMPAHHKAITLGIIDRVEHQLLACFQSLLASPGDGCGISVCPPPTA